MKFTEFGPRLLAGAYLESERTGKQIADSGDVIDAFGLQFNPGWVHKVIADWGARGLAKDHRTLGDDRSQPIMLTAAGMEEAERLLETGILDGAGPTIEGEVVSREPEKRKSETERQQIVEKLKAAQARLSSMGLRQDEFAQANAHLAAAISLAEAPTPPWAIIKMILLGVAGLLGAAGSVATILQLL